MSTSHNGFHISRYLHGTLQRIYHGPCPKIHSNTMVPISASHATLLHSLSAFISLSRKLHSDRQTTSSMCTQDALYYAHSWFTQSKRTLDKVHKVLTSKRGSIHYCLKRSPFSLAKRPVSIDNFMHKQMANLCHINMY